MNKIVYYKGYTQYHNIGDQLINISLLDHFRKHASVVISDDKMPDFYLHALDITDEERVSKTGKGFHQALVRDALGSCFNRNRKLYFLASPPGHQFENSFVTGCKYLLSGFFYLFLHILGVHIIKIGFSIGPLSKMGKIGERFRALFVKSYYVRDSISLDFVHQIGIAHGSMFPDLCWSYTPKSEEEITAEPIIEGARTKIILSFRSAVHGETKSDAYTAPLLALLERLIAKYEKTYTFEIAYQVASDRAFSEQLYAHFKEKYPVLFKADQIDLKDAVYYQSAGFVLTNRLHVALLAYKFDCIPAVVTDIKQHAKINGIFSDAAIAELLVDTEAPVEQSLLSLEVVLNEKEAFLEKFKQVEEFYRGSSDQVMKHIFSV